MSMKEAFDAFFEEMDRNSMKVRGKLPCLPFQLGQQKKHYFLKKPEINRIGQCGGRDCRQNHFLLMK